MRPLKTRFTRLLGRFVLAAVLFTAGLFFAGLQPNGLDGDPNATVPYVLTFLFFFGLIVRWPWVIAFPALLNAGDVIHDLVKAHGDPIYWEYPLGGPLLWTAVETTVLGLGLALRSVVQHAIQWRREQRGAQ